MEEYESQNYDTAEVFVLARELKHTGVLVRASHNRSLDPNSERL